MQKRQKTALESGALLVIVAGVLIALNALSALGLYKRADMTKTERFTLSKGSGNLLRSMKQNMEIDAYVTRGLPKLDAFVGDLRDLLQEYKGSSAGKFDFQLIEAKDEATKKVAKDAGLVEQPFGEASDTEDKAAVAQGFMGLVFKYGGETDPKNSLKFLPPDRTDGLEFWITNKIREVRDNGDGIKHKIGILTGHDEIKPSETNLVPSNMGKYAIQGIITQNFPFYQFQDVDLKAGESEVDDTLDGLIITQPGKDLTDKELRRINQFVMKGKSLAVLASAVNIKASDASMNATLNTHGLEKLLGGYGIDMGKDVVLDFGRAFHVNLVTQSGGVARAWFPQFLTVSDDSRLTGNEQLLDTGFPAFFRLQEIVIPLASSLTLNSSKQPDAKLAIHARSTPNSRKVTTDTVDLKPLQKMLPPKKSDAQQFNIAASAEGTLATAFPDGDADGVDAPAKSSKNARVMVIASSEFLANPLARAGNGPDMGQMGGMMPQGGGDEQLLQLAGPYAQEAVTSTIVSFKNTLDYLSGDTDLLAVSAKILSEPNLEYGDVTKPTFDEDEAGLEKRADDAKRARKTQQIVIECVLTIGIPLLLVLLGLVRWFARNASRAKVSLA